MYALKETHFLTDRFRAGVKDLEVMVQNLIASAFETVTTSQEGVEILDIFQHLSSREVIIK
jgi:dynein heavy chain